MSAPPVRLRGIAWDHSRGFTPIVATAQRYAELHPGVEIHWEKRSLQAFADSPIEELAESFDLLVIDHPFAGFASRHPVLVDLSERVPAAELAGLAANSVGASHQSYRTGTQQWALAIDAATPVSGWREDLLNLHRVQPPADWPELLELARHGLVAVAGIPVDCLMNFFMFCHAQGEEPCTGAERVVSDEAGLAALDMQSELMRLLSPDTWDSNPIRIWERLAYGRERPAYCPFAYGYSNYARAGYAPAVLRFGGLPSFRHRRLRPTLGGTGIAVSARCDHMDHAIGYARLTASPGWQRTLYFESGGQPAHRSAWTDPEVNRRANFFFRDTLATHDDSWVRPRYCGYLEFQDQGGGLVRDFLLGQASAKATLEALNTLYRSSLAQA
jgi:multiple sugar transport system substrate-binding protein